LLHTSIFSLEYEVNGYYPKLKEGDFLSCLNVVIPISWLGDDVDKILNEIKKLRSKVDGIGEVSLENTSYDELALNFRWFPHTMVMSQITLCGDFIKLLLKKFVWVRIFFHYRLFCAIYTFCIVLKN